MTDILYEDKDITITKTHLIIKCYFFPFGNSKKIRFRDIQKVQIKYFSWRGKLWGMNVTEWGYWMPGDLKRWNYDRFVAVYNGSSITPCFTCLDMQRAYNILKDQIFKQNQLKQPNQKNQNEEEQKMMIKQQ